MPVDIQPDRHRDYYALDAPIAGRQMKDKRVTLINVFSSMTGKWGLLTPCTRSSQRLALAHVKWDFSNINNNNEKKRSERRKHCAPAVVRRSQKFRPTADPVPGGAGRPKFNQLEMVITFTYRPSLVRIDARNFELSWYRVQTQKHTHKPTDRTDYNTLRC